MIPDAASTSGGDDGIGGGGGGGIGGGGGDVGIRFINTDAPISSCEDEGGEVVFVDVKREDGGTRRCNANAGTESYLDDQTGDTVQKMDGLQMTTATSSQMANALGKANENKPEMWNIVTVLPSQFYLHSSTFTVLPSQFYRHSTSSQYIVTVHRHNSTQTSDGGGHAVLH